MVLSSSDQKYILVVNPDIECMANGLNVAAESQTLKNKLATYSATDIVEILSDLELVCCLIQDSSEVLADSYLENNHFWEVEQSTEVKGTGILIGGSIWKVDNEREYLILNQFAQFALE